MILGLELIRQESNVTSVSMAADNIGAVQRLATARATPTQYIWEIFRKWWAMTKGRHKHIALTVRWVPGHEGIPGNEEADRVAKLAIEKGSSRRDRLPAPLWKAIPHSKQAFARTVLTKLKRRADTAWRESPRCKKFKDIDDSMPSKKYMELIAGLSRRKASLLIQLRSGHVPLSAHLHRIRCTESPMCAQCGGAVLHYAMPGVCGAKKQLAQRGGTV